MLILDVFCQQNCYQCCSHRWVLTITEHRLHSIKASPDSEEAGDAQGAGRGHSWDNGPHLTKGIFWIIWHHARQEKLQERRRKGEKFEWEYFSPQFVACERDGALFSWRWISTYLSMSYSRKQAIVHFPAICYFCWRCTSRENSPNQNDRIFFHNWKGYRSISSQIILYKELNCNGDFGCTLCNQYF